MLQQRQQKSETGDKKVGFSTVSSGDGLLRKPGHLQTPRVGLPSAPRGGVLFRCGNGIGEDDLGQAVLVSGVGIGEVCFRFLEYGLAKLNNGAEAQIVA